MADKLLTLLSERDEGLLLISLLGLVAHQVFKRYETFNISVHLSLLLLPPILGVALLKPLLVFSHAVVLSYTIYLGTLALSVLAYRVSPFHPLAQYPGPLVCCLSKFWMAKIGYSGRQHLYIRGLHDRYGDIVRIGPNELSLRDPSMLGPIYGATGLPHGPRYIGRLLSATNLPLVAIMDTDEHLERRKPWARAFTSTALKEYQPMIAARTGQLVHALGQQVGEVDLATWVNYFSYDVMSDMAFGGGSELLRDGDVGNVWHILDGSLPVAMFLSHIPWLGPYLGRVPILVASQRQLLSHCQKLTLERLRRGSQQSDIFHYLNEEDQPENLPPSLSRMVDEGVLAVVAGADTTSSALTSIFYCLVTHPDAYKRLQAEIDHFYPPGEDACDTRHHLEMHYLAAVINEGMRVWSPVPSGVERSVPHNSKGFLIGTTFIPAGTSISVHSYSVLLDPRNFF